MKMKTLFAVVATAILLTGPLFAEDKKKDPLKDIKCPVTGKAVQAASTVAYKGAKVYFCCDNCPKAFQKDTAKFAAKANHQLFATKQATLVRCPILGKKLNGKTVIDIAGTKVSFCCANCRKKVEDAEDQIEVVFNDTQFNKGFKIVTKKRVKGKE